MDARTLTALQASIKHWEENVAAETPLDIMLGIKSCDLCLMFYSLADSCNGCPVAAATGHGTCFDTPYEDACDAGELWDENEADEELKSGWAAAATAELNFLKSLLPESPK